MGDPIVERIKINSNAYKKAKSIPQEREVSPEEALIENILDMIPIFQ